MRVDGIKIPAQKKKPTGEKMNVHNILISDASGSMMGSKYQASTDSIKAELHLLSQDDNVNYLQTLVEFDSGRLVKHFWRTPGKKATTFNGIGANGGTPLYTTIGNILTELEKVVGENDRVLVKVFTDGDDTEYGRGAWNIRTLGVYLNKLINVKNWTITFNCTQQDKSTIMKIGIPESNILTHENTAESIYQTAVMRSDATISYSRSIADGASADSLRANFYSKSK